MDPSLPSPDAQPDALLAERLEALARWIQEIDTRVRATEAATGDEHTAKELRKAIEALAKHDPRLEERLTDRVDVLAERLSTLATTVSTTAAALAGKGGEIAGLRRELEAGRQRIEELAADLRGGLDPAAIEELRRTVATLAHDVAARRGAEPLDALGGRIDAVGQRLDTLAATVAVTAAGLAGREGELATLRRKLDALAGEPRQPQSPDALRPQLDELAARLATLERDREGAAYEIAQTTDTLATEQASLRQQVDALAAAGAPADSMSPTLVALAERLEGVEREGAALGSEIARATAFWSAELGSLETRLAELVSAQTSASEPGSEDRDRVLSAMAARLDAIEQERETVSAKIARLAESSAAGDEVAQLRVLLDGLRMRVGRGEKELAALPASGDVAARLDDLGRRLDSLEQGLESAPLAPIPGDGRFRLELRALELRMDHTEATSRESREAVLTQLERLASRIEWRLQRLEAEKNRASEPIARAGVGGQVVPFRAEDR